MTDDRNHEAKKNSAYLVLRECFTESVLHWTTKPDKPVRKRSRRRKGETNDENTTSSIERQETRAQIDDLSEFIDYLAGEIWFTFPKSLKSLSSGDEMPQDLAEIVDEVIGVTAPEVLHSLEAYVLNDTEGSLPSFLLGVVNAYAASATRTAAPCGKECEICSRDWIPLTAHHLVPRSTHAKAQKRRWHSDQKLGEVAWLCRACHNFVHRMASNEELALHWHSIETIMERDDVVKWAQWASSVRWKAR